jgi:hypothetical protein
MTVLQQFQYTWPEGTTPIQFNDWITTLPQADQDEFAQAVSRQQAIRQQYVDNGLLSVVPEGYEWKDQAAQINGKPNDPTWEIYWARWIRETGVTFSYTVV